MSNETVLMDEGLELLDEAECRRLLGTVRLGRVAVSLGALPAIFPVNFVLVDGDILFRTGAGTKLDAAVRRAVVAFEADHTDDVAHAGWSVQAVGIVDEIAEGDPLAGVEVSPWAGGDRRHLMRIRPEILTGRRSHAVS